MEKFDKTLELLASMNADEFRKLQDLIAKTELVEENALKEIEPPAEIKKNAELWLAEQKKTQSSESYILHSIKKYHLKKVDYLTDKIEHLKHKAVRQQKKIIKLNSTKKKAEKALEQFNLKLEKLEVGKAFLNGVEESHSSVVDMMINLNSRKYERCLKKIASIKESFSVTDKKITNCNAKISRFEKKVKEAEEKISLHKYRVQHIRDFHKLHVPHELLSFYIAEKTNTDIVKLNEALNNPMSLFSKKEINDGLPFVPPEMPNTELTKLDSPEISKNQVELYSDFNNIAEANMIEPVPDEKAYFKEISDEELGKLADNDVKVIAKPHPEKEHSYIIKTTQSEFEKINKILTIPSKNTVITR